MQLSWRLFNRRKDKDIQQSVPLKAVCSESKKKRALFCGVLCRRFSVTMMTRAMLMIMSAFVLPVPSLWSLITPMMVDSGRTAAVPVRSVGGGQKFMCR